MTTTQTTRVKYKDDSDNSFKDIVLPPENGGTGSTSSLTDAEIDEIWGSTTGSNLDSLDILPVLHGGTGASSALSRAEIDEIWNLSNVTGTGQSVITAISNGGTGSTNVEDFNNNHLHAAHMNGDNLTEVSSWQDILDIFPDGNVKVGHYRRDIGPSEWLSDSGGVRADRIINFDTPFEDDNVAVFVSPAVGTDWGTIYSHSFWEVCDVTASGFKAVFHTATQPSGVDIHPWFYWMAVRKDELERNY